MMFLISLVVAIFVVSPPWSWVVLAVGVFLEVGESYLFMRWSRRRGAAVGTEVLVGRRAIVSVACRPDGQVRVAGEIWRAHCDAGADVGDAVVVRAVDGLVLVVDPV
jgi:membrane protein implicated in regulation of membrane protease activity